MNGQSNCPQLAWDRKQWAKRTDSETGVRVGQARARGHLESHLFKSQINRNLREFKFSLVATKQQSRLK
jgi:hypothetical protein